MNRVNLTAAVLGDIVLATSPSVPSGTCQLVALFGIDGVNVGADADGDEMVYPAAMSEGAPGVYAVEVSIDSSGVYFAIFQVDGVRFGPTLVRVHDDEAWGVDATVGSAITIGIVAASRPASIAVTITDREGTGVGASSDGDAYSWPVQAQRVPGYSDCWFLDDVVFDEGGKVHVAMVGPTGPSWNDVLSVRQTVQGSASHFDGWQPDAAYSPSDWISIGMIRRLTGWSANVVPDRTVRELRRMAIETFVERTNRWIPPWSGTWHGLRGQGSRMYIPVPVLLVQDGAASAPVVTVTDAFGDQQSVEVVSHESLSWRIRGVHSNQPFIERSSAWDSSKNVKIQGTFGSVGSLSQVPLRVQQCLVGLIRWLSLSYGVGPDEARDAATLNRITSESSREKSVSYHESAIGSGLTGDVVIDRILAEYTIHPGPWISRGHNP